MRPVRTAFALAMVVLAGCNRPADSEVDRTAYRDAPVILISIDTLRADRLPAYGYQEVRTPHIDALRADGILFRNAYSHVPLTLPSHASLLTGKLPADHGVRDNLGYRITSDGATLPQLLRAGGYATGAAVSAYVLRGETGMAAMFDEYDDRIAFEGGTELGALQRPGSATAAAGARWIARQGEKPFFFLLHLFEPHTPYEPPEPFRSATANPYDGEIAHADAIVGTFLDSLKTSGVYDRAIVVLLSDHGEGLGDHGEAEHGIFVYREAMQVPLIVKLPKGSGAGGTFEEPVGLTDILPTILSLTGRPLPAKLAGVPLLGPLARPAGNRRIFGESVYGRLHLGWSDLRSLVDSTHHYIDAPRAELYSVRDDPREQKNLLAEERRVAASFRAALEAHPRNLTAPTAVSSEEAAKLTALGYVSAPSTSAGAELPDPKDGIAQLERYATANRAFSRGDVDAAIAGFRAVLDENPNFTDAAIHLARAYESGRRFAEAAEIYRGILARNPALTEQVAIGVATAFLNMGRLEDARAHAELAVRSNPGGAHLLLGRIALAAKNGAGAERHAREASRNAHYAADATLLLGEALLAQQRPADALRELDAFKSARAARAEPPLRSLEVARANALMRLSRPDDALAALREEVRRFPDDRNAYGRIAAIHLLRKDASAAEAVLREMVAAIPAPQTYAFAADTLAHFGQHQAAERFRRREFEVSSR